MTPAEFDRQIEQILAIQRDLQEGQIELKAIQAEHAIQLAEQSRQIAGLVTVAQSINQATQALNEEAKTILQVQLKQSEDIAQLKRTVDYLLSKDGGLDET